VNPGGDEAFAVIGRLALAARASVTCQVAAGSHLFADRPLVGFAMRLLQRHRFATGRARLRVARCRPASGSPDEWVREWRPRGASHRVARAVIVVE